KDTSSELFIYSAKYFRVFQLNLLLAGFNIAVSGYYTAVERAFEAMTISLLRSFLLIAVGLFLLTALFGGDAMWWSVLFAELITALFTVLRKRL
ncbi:MAG: MATE family efflux transporter, partial [Eubacteriales bacterium]|nr:MATE family efflux transporter [Eubacteriales bacterium]